jgi:hypothetical protein
MLVGPVHAGIYKWVDEHGRVHYSDTPRENATAVTVDPAPAGAPAANSGERLRAQQQYLQARERERSRKKQEQAIEKQQARSRERRCNRARDRLRRLTRASGLYRLGKDGEREFLSHSERAAAEQRARKDVDKWCH